MRGRLLPIACIALLVLLACARVGSLWDALPERMASHFGPSGRPDAWTSKTSFFTSFAVIGLGTLMTLLLPQWFLHYVPASLINIPYRHYWLTPERRPEALARLGRSLDWLNVGLALLLVATLELVLRANLAGAPLDSAVMLVMIVAFFAFTILWLFRMYRDFRPPDGSLKGQGR